MGRAIAPSGASTGRHEALELRDNDSARFGGLGVLRAVSHVCGEIHAGLVGSDIVDQEGIDRKLVQIDGTPNRSRLGANALLGVSLAVARAAAATQNLALWRYLDRGGNALLPMPMVNIISGGLHAGGAADFQDYLIIPVGAASYHEALEMCLQVHRTTAEVLQQLGHPTLKADEGGYGPVLPDNRAALDLLMQVVDRAGSTDCFRIRCRCVALLLFRRQKVPIEIGKLFFGCRRNGGPSRRFGRAVPNHLNRGWLGRGRLARLAVVDRAVGRSG